MEIDFKHRSKLYLNCNRTSLVYRCNNVNVKCQYQQLQIYYTTPWPKETAPLNMSK